MQPQTQIITKPPVDSLPPALRGIVPPAIWPIPPEARLTPVQQEVFALLIVGISDTEAAKKLGINRSTIWRWRTGDPNFIAALNNWRANVIECVRDSMLSLTEAAEEVIAASIRDGNARLALQVLEKMGTIRRGRVSPIDAFEVARRRMSKRVCEKPGAGSR